MSQAMERPDEGGILKAFAAPAEGGPCGAEIGPISLTSPPYSRPGEVSEFDAGTHVGEPPAEGATNGPADGPPLTVAGIREALGAAPPAREPAEVQPPSACGGAAGRYGFSDELVHAVRRRIGHDGLMLLSLLKQVTGAYDGVLAHPSDQGMSDYLGDQRAAAAARREIELAAAELGLPVELVGKHWRELLDVCRMIGPGELLDRSAATLFVITCLPGQAEPNGQATGLFRQVQLVERLACGEGRPLNARSEEVTGIARTDASFESYALVVGKLVLRLSLQRPDALIRFVHCADSLWEALMRPEAG